MSRLWRGFGLLLYSLAFALLLLFVAEFWARDWLHNRATMEELRRFGALEVARIHHEDGKPPLYKYEPHRYIGYVPAANFVEGENRHNDLGFRGAPFPRRKPPGEFRIVCLGGSTTYTTFAGDWTQAYPARLEAEFREHGFDRVRVINGGVEGYTSWESLMNFQLRVLDLDPDLVIVYHGVNDAFARMVRPPAAYRGDNSGSVIDSPGWDRPVPWGQRLISVRLLRAALGMSENWHLGRNVFVDTSASSLFLRFWGQQLENQYPDDVFEKFPLEKIYAKNPPIYFRRNLENLIVQAQHRGIAVVLATFAYDDESFEREKYLAGLADLPRDPSDKDGSVARERAYIWHSAPVFGAIDEHNTVVRDLGADLNVPVFDFAPVFPNGLAQYMDPFHVTVQGSRQKAALFFDFLRESGLTPASGDRAGTE